MSAGTDTDLYRHTPNDSFVPHRDFDTVDNSVVNEQSLDTAETASGGAAPVLALGDGSSLWLRFYAPDGRRG